MDTICRNDVVCCQTQEHEASVHLERGHRQTPSGTINSDEFRSIHRRRAAYIASNRLPGSVLLARERLVERLRGVSVSGNRYTRHKTLH